MRRFLSEGEGTMAVDLPAGTTVRDALDTLGVPPAEQWNAAVGGQLVYAGTELTEGDRLLVFPPLAGG